MKFCLMGQEGWMTRVLLPLVIFNILTALVYRLQSTMIITWKGEYLSKTPNALLQEDSWILYEQKMNCSAFACFHPYSMNWSRNRPRTLFLIVSESGLGWFCCIYFSMMILLRSLIFYMTMPRSSTVVPVSRPVYRGGVVVNLEDAAVLLQWLDHT